MRGRARQALDWRLLPAVGGVPEETVRRGLADAVGVQLVVVDDEGEFHFRHTLTRDVVLAAVLPGLVGARTYHERPAVQGAYFSYWSGVPVDGGALYPRDGYTVYAFPTHDDLTLVGVNWRIDTWRRVRADIAGEHRRAVAGAAPALAEKLTSGRREERWVGAATPGFFRRPYGPGWALVGDAGYTKDPCTAQGISDAFRQAEWLAAAVDDGLAGRRPILAAMADYQRVRDEAALPTYEFTCEAARMESSPEMGAYLASLQGDPVGIERFFGVFAGTLAPHEVFGPPSGTLAA